MYVSRDDSSLTKLNTYMIDLKTFEEPSKDKIRATLTPFYTSAFNPLKIMWSAFLLALTHIILIIK